MAEEKELSREEKIAQLRAKADALKKQRAATGAPGTTAGAPAGAAFEVPVSAANPAGRPVDRAAGKKIRAYGTVNQAVDIHADASELENLKKLLTGISGYQNPLRRGMIQVDYRYYAEARRRLEQAGYEIEETDFMGRPLRNWSPENRGWTLVEGG